jgi:hypothetical protein
MINQKRTTSIFQTVAKESISTLNIDEMQYF